MENKKSKKEIVIAEVVSGAITAFLVSPGNVVVDKSVMLYANKLAPSLWGAAGNELKSVFTTPTRFFTSFEFRWMYFVYAFTYGASNLKDNFKFTESIDPKY